MTMNLQMLLGNRYGSRPLPVSIPQEEMNHILAYSKHVENNELLQEWYIRDDNSVPPEYILQEVTKNLNADNHSEGDIIKAREKWRTMECLVKDCLRKCVSLCREDGTMTKEVSERYFWSGKCLLYTKKYE